MAGGPHRSTARALLPWAILVILTGLVAGAAAALAPWRAWSAAPDIAARVNGEPVARAELQRMLADPTMRQQLQRELGVQGPDSKELERLALRKLINRRLILQEARRQELEVSEQDLAQAVAAVRGRFKDLEAFRAWLSARGLDDKSLLDAIRIEMLGTRATAALVQGVRLTDEQAQEYYEAHKDDLKAAEGVKLRVIAVKDRAAADEILATVRKGGDFARLARERSVAPHAAQDGDTGWIGLPALPPPLRTAVSKLKVGETGGPLQTGAEFLLIRLEERRPARARSVAEARPEIERRLLPAKRREVVHAWLTEQEKKSKIEVFP